MNISTPGFLQEVTDFSHTDRKWVAIPSCTGSLLPVSVP